MVIMLMVIIMLMAMRRDLMGRFVLPWALGWLSTGTTAAAVGLMLQIGEGGRSRAF
jgi:hypothetical protein